MSRWIRRSSHTLSLGIATCALAAAGAIGCGPSFEDGDGGAGGASGASSSDASTSTGDTSSSVSTSTGSTSTGTTTTTTTTSVSGSSSSGMPSLNCDITDGAEIDASCGVFVKAGATGTGTKASPLGSIQDAVDATAATKLPIYVCAEFFDETIVVPSGAKIYGAIDCTQGWKWVASPAIGERTHLRGQADEVTLVIEDGIAETRIFGFHVEAVDAKGLSGSSQAAIVRGGQVAFAYVHFTAGDGVSGTDGGVGAPWPDPTPSANGGNTHFFGFCSSPSAFGYDGGAQSVNACLAPSTGGSGGKGGNGAGSNAADGSAGLIDGVQLGGAGGKGERLVGMFNFEVPCANGSPGPDGGEGDDGVGAAGPGALTPLGYTPVYGTPGGYGTNGGGGGGGGGARTPDGCWGGDGGGSGGAGGCGGNAGGGGGGGGSSIAIISLHGVLSFESCSAVVGLAGRGGHGGAGGVGSPGAPGGAPPLYPSAAPQACYGGAGGNGGPGGHGGGGAGGHAIGLACQGACDASGLIVNIPPGAAGGPGIGNGSNDGDAGFAAAQMTFPG